MANCRHCGYPLSENDQTCFMCGTEVKAAPAPVQAAPVQPAPGGVELCPQCGCPLDADDTVCSLCGAEIPNRKAAPAPVQPAQAAPAQPVSGGVELCPQCGCPLDADDTVCSLCGAKVTAAAAAPQTHAAPKTAYQPVQAAQQSSQTGIVADNRPPKWLTFLFGYFMPFIALIVWLIKKNSSAWVREDVKRGLVWFGVAFLLIAVTGGMLIPIFPIGGVVGAVLAGRK